MFEIMQHFRPVSSLQLTTDLWLLCFGTKKCLIFHAYNQNILTLVLLNPDIISSVENSVAGPRSAVGKVSDSRSRGPEFNPGPAWSYTFVEIDHEIISTAILLPFTDSRRVVVSYNRKYVHKVLVNCLVKLAQEKVW